MLDMARESQAVHAGVCASEQENGDEQCVRSGEIRSIRTAFRMTIGRRGSIEAGSAVAQSEQQEIGRMKVEL